MKYSKHIHRHVTGSHAGKLFLFAGGWLSLVAVIFLGSSMLTTTPDASQNSPALLYKLAMNDRGQSGGNFILPKTSGKAIVADLERMTLALYENNIKTEEFTILSRGREGTFWETPTGRYSIQSKEQEHLSSIGGTWMPYSMQFYGNFFIHGWPTYQNGEDVPKGYSGGCIRLATKDAKVVYTFADMGTRVYVTGGPTRDAFATSSAYYLRGGGTLPEISSPSFIVADPELGATLWERNAQKEVSPGGLTALATALTALETVNQYKIVRMSELLLGKSVLRNRSIGAVDELPVGSLIYPLLFDANDTAAKVFARAQGEKQFTASMNEKALAIGMDDTQFGGALSSDDSTTTAHDLLNLLHYVDESKHFIIDTSLAEERILSDKNGKERYTWKNKNPWVIAKDSTYQGGVAVMNAEGAGSALVLFDIPLAEFGNRTIAFVVLDSQDLIKDVDAMRTFIAEHFVFGIEREQLVREGDEPTPSLLQKAKEALNLNGLLQDQVSYERER